MANILTKVAMLLIVIAFPMGALAHDHGQANSLAAARSKMGGLCCDGKDYIVPADWRRSDKGYRVLIGTAWFDVPKDAEVNNMNNPDMEAKVWLYHAEGETVIRCFMPGMEV